MSLLLDALNKADQERKRSDGPPSIDSHHEGYRADHHSKSPTLIIVLGIGIILIVLLAAVYWLGMRQAATTPPASIAPIATSPSNPQQSTAGPEPQPGTTNSGQKVINAERSNDVTNISNAENDNVSRTETTTGDGDVANLYQQKIANNPPPTNSNATIAEKNNTTEIQKDIPTSPTSINQFANLPELNDLPTNILEKIPTLKYTEHNFNQNGGSVVINGMVKHANDELVTGVVIDKILVDGMILHADNYSFKMRALNTWFNM